MDQTQQFRVLVSHPPPNEAAELLRSLLEPRVILTIGPERPDPPAFDMLIAGRPSAEDLDSNKRLRWLVIPWAGLPRGTRELMRARPHIEVHNIHHNADAAAEQAIALLLAAAKALVPMDRALRAHDWRPRYDAEPPIMLTGRTMLVLGYGAVGRRIARIASSLGMRVIGVRRRAVRDGSETDDVLDELHGVEMLHDLLPRADVLGVCLPFTEQTDGLIGAEEIALLPERAILVNVGRGEIVDETALFEALSDGRLAAAGIDVWYQYPASEAERGRTPPASMPFGELENVVLSPHRGGGFGAAEVEESRVRELAKLINAAARGEPMPNRVHIERGY